MSDEVLRDLARRVGIAVDWQDYAGKSHEVAVPVLRQVLNALRIPADNTRDLSASRRSLTKRTGPDDLPPLVTAVAGRPTRLDIGASEAMSAELILERGERRALTLLPARGRLRVPAIAETGYHRLSLGNREIVLAVCPARCWSIDDVVPDARLWGLAAQLYGLNHPGDGGIGDMSGVAELARVAGAKGADAISLSPVHALFAADPGHFGPYSPSSRLFRNPLHASPTLVFGEYASERNQARLIDWPAASATKYAALRAKFQSFLQSDEWNGPLGASFARYRAEGGVLLREHACFEALHAERMPLRDWRAWPSDLRDPGGPAVAFFAAAHAGEILYHQFLQWISDRSVAIAQNAARQAGMRIGLIGDLAVGMDPAGSHAWGRQADILSGLTIGAPPDLLNPAGQDWGLTSFSPRTMQATGFAPFLATLRAAMRHAGGIRVDHVMGLARLWLIPVGASPAHGAYLNFPVTDLLRLLALESVRNKVVAIGEDLGTLPRGFHDMLEQTGVHGMRVLWFERDGNAGFGTTRSWGRSGIAMTSTHDLPTVAGWWKGLDIDVRDEFGRLGEGVDPASVRQEREADRPKLWHAFVAEHAAEGSVPGSDEPEPVVDAAVRFTAMTETPLVLVPLEDLLGRTGQPNLPGTVDGHPNWRRRQPGTADELLSDETIAARIDLIAAERPRQ